MTAIFFKSKLFINSKENGGNDILLNHNIGWFSLYIKNKNIKNFNNLFSLRVYYNNDINTMYAGKTYDVKIAFLEENMFFNVFNKDEKDFEVLYSFNTDKIFGKLKIIKK